MGLVAPLAEFFAAVVKQFGRERAAPDPCHICLRDADDFIDMKLDLNNYLIKHPAATFFVKVEGDSMVNAGINNGDILIVDRALEASDKKVVSRLRKSQL